jgi:hypothetical protein
MNSRFGLLIICAVLCVLLGISSIAAQTPPAPAATQPKPAAVSTKANFSGTWTMNRQKSKFANEGPDAITIKLDHKDDTLAETLTMSGGNGERTIATKYSTDGKESDLQLGSDTAKATVKWEGEAIVIEWKAGEGRFFRRKLTLSPDGKMLTMNVKQDRPDGNTGEDLIVFEKQ